MRFDMEMIVHALAIGIGATLVMDAWGLLLRRGFGVRSLDYAMVGRWLGHMPAGTFAHERIAAAAAIPGERVIGWTAHYATGVLFAALLLAVFGGGWARQPTFVPALLTGVLTMAAPFFIMQPGMGIGIAASKTPNPNVARLRSLATHIVFGTGLYASAWVLARLDAM
jgi:hypothetical protein